MKRKLFSLRDLLVKVMTEDFSASYGKLSGSS